MPLHGPAISRLARSLRSGWLVTQFGAFELFREGYGTIPCGSLHLSFYDVAALNFLYVVMLPLQILPEWVFRPSGFFLDVFDAASPRAAELLLGVMAVYANFQVGLIALMLAEWLVSQIARRSGFAEPLPRER